MTFLALVIVGIASSQAAADKSATIYQDQVKPLLRSHCYGCHGALKQKGGLRLDTVASLIKGGDSGPAVKPGDAAASLIMERVSAVDPGERMPPENEGEPLTKPQVDLLRDWIVSGTPAPDDEQPEADPAEHWAFQPVTRPQVPAVGHPHVIRNPIDAFLARQHKERKIVAQGEAARIVLLRRLYLDLIGIPPSHDEIRAFENDRSSDWYARTVTRLLDDPRHGERWGRHWMDIWRYSDWWGFGAQLRNSQRHMWHFRDWIVESLNEDVPYDEMVRLMLAADELHPNDLDKLRATGFLARNYFLFNRPQWMEQTVEHVSKGLLGLTMNCAKCHDHKYDPIEQTDFYAMRAFFEPYHVRLDVVPGEADLERNGIPRVYDGLIEDPTYVYIRGDEKNPDKSKPIPPGVPKLLKFDELKIDPVKLPVEAWQPQRRPWVIDAFLADARKQVESAQQALRAAEAKLLQARKIETTALAALKGKSPGESKPDRQEWLIADDFKQHDMKRWRLFGGDWKHTPGRLEQKKDGKTRAALQWTGKPPRDFDAIVRFTITGGSQYRSVGLSFDVAPGDPTQDSLPTYSEQNVYVSGQSAGSKIHAAYNQDGRWHYPQGPAVKQLPVPLNREHSLRVQVRDRVINASLNGELVITCQAPVARRDGGLQVTTFDATVVFHGIRIQTLDPDEPLVTPGESRPSPKAAAQAVALAEIDRRIAEADVQVALAARASVESRAAAKRSVWNEEPDENQSSSHQRAVIDERELAVARASRAVAAAEKTVADAEAANDQKKIDAANKTLVTARSALEKAEAKLKAGVKPGEDVTGFVGARWTATRFFSSGRDDPTVEFQKTSTGRRTALAAWITDKRNPLTARVAVNHVWTRHFGKPLVPTVFDFGRKGTPPTHPELLDWLASEFMDNDWSMKHVHRLIVTSAAYRRRSSSVGGEASIAVDPDNRLWWRREPIRIESQVVRDSLLSLAGTLDSKRGGPSVPTAQQATSTRRSLYFFHSNNERNPFLTTFDEASVKDCYRRQQSIVPQQALALSNSRLVLDSAAKIALRISSDAGNERDFVRRAFAVVAGIEARDEELASAASAIKSWQALPGSTEEKARARLVWALLNHNDFVTLR